MPIDLKKLVSMGKKAAETVQELQRQASVRDAAADEAAAEAREPHPAAAGDALVLYWQEAGDDTGWYCDRYEGGDVVLEAGRVGEETANTPEALAVAKQLFREHFGRELAWEQPDPSEPRYLGRPSG